MSHPPAADAPYPPLDGPGVNSESSSNTEDDLELKALGYVPSFKREFSNLATISFAFSILGVCSSVATTFNTPLLLGGPASVTWCWLIGSCMSLTLGASIAEIVSAFPTCGGMYTAAGRLVPTKHRPIVGWVVGWTSVVGQIVGLSSVEFGLANMIWSAVGVARDGNYDVTPGKVVGLSAGLLVVQGFLNSFATRHLARFTTYFVFINIGATIAIIIVLLATTHRSEMHPASSGYNGIITTFIVFPVLLSPPVHPFNTDARNPSPIFSHKGSIARFFCDNIRLG
ncbi:hypothetical protein FIBSPDRAFT_950703 [Athelia psychrophila]|uniref:Amino acid permease/ SLC12A domain-containing protein n=1 Tax=Athelia psychrophila TaxID=1759441 RepID=A0A166NHF1_9AGAM|nr:hypothetical protein FIBSPDRAFT_950703 [Fibularhizoctonia sp. CBS 109695]